jgi:hypothetical protein
MKRVGIVGGESWQQDGGQKDVHRQTGCGDPIRFSRWQKDDDRVSGFIG